MGQGSSYAPWGGPGPHWRVRSSLGHPQLGQLIYILFLYMYVFCIYLYIYINNISISLYIVYIYISSLERKLPMSPFLGVGRFPLPSHTQTPGSDAGTGRDPLRRKLHKSQCDATAPDKMKASIWFRSALKTIQRAISIHPA